MAKLAIACQWMTKDVLLILGAFFIGFLGRRVSGIILQYSSYKFNWEFSKVTTNPIFSWNSHATQGLTRVYRHHIFILLVLE